MNTASSPEQAAVQAIHVTTESQRLAFRVVDAIDELQCQLGALRAIQQLTSNEGRGSAESLPQLQRRDLAILLSVVSVDLEARCAVARDVAAEAAKAA